MKKILSWMLVLALIASLGCAGALAADDENEIVGIYTLVDMPGAEIPGMDQIAGMLGGLGLPESFEIDTAMLLKIMTVMGQTATLEIRDDGTAAMDLFGSGGEIEFDLDTLTATVGEKSVTCTYEDGRLTFPIEGTILVFEKENPLARYSGAYDYYKLEKFVEDGKELDLKTLDVLPALYLFDSGAAIMTSASGSLPIEFDLEAMTARMQVDEEEVSVPFTLKDGVLGMSEDGGDLTFRLADPGYSGPFAMTGLITQDSGDVTEQLPLLASVGLLPTLTINEDGSGSLDLFGETIEFSFDFDKMKVTTPEEDEALDFLYENGVLKITQDENSMSFRRMPSEEDLALIADLIGAKAGG